MLLPAAQSLVNAGLFTSAQLLSLQAHPAQLTPVPAGQVSMAGLRDLDLNISWQGKIKERITVVPSVAFYNAFNLANYDLPTATLSGTLSATTDSINGTPRGARNDRVGSGTGVFGLGSPRILEFGLKILFSLKSGGKLRLKKPPMAPGKLEPLAYCFWEVHRNSACARLASRETMAVPLLYFDQAVFPFAACYCESVEMAVDAKSGHRGITPSGVAEPVRPPALCAGFTAECDLPPFSRPRASNPQNSWLRPLIGIRGLEFRATHCKQRVATISNRDKKALCILGAFAGRPNF